MAQDETLSIRIDAELKKQITALAEKQGRTPGNLIKYLLRQALEQEKEKATK
jgi:antitoxin component of RelBE/YafQ-DinJ toxin-antitoxin module